MGRIPTRVLALAIAVLAAALAAPGAAGAQARWLAGDNHVHTCYSHDAWCPPDDDNTGPDTFYSSFGTVDQRFREAAVKGLDYIVISDHNDIRAQADPAFGAHGVLGVPGYEASLRGHAQMLGARRLYAAGDRSPTAVRALADELNADGGVFQANHPAYRAESVFQDCAQADSESNPLDWSYGFQVRPDSIEVWNPTSLITPAERYWECWLQRDPGYVRIGATGGSDTHGASQPTLGNPTTWVFAEERSPRAVLAAIRAGRTTLTRPAPRQGGGRLLLEGDGDGDGRFEAKVGDAIRPGSTLRVVAEGLGGRVRVRFNGTTVVDGPIAPGVPLTFPTPPGRPGWARAVLFAEHETQPLDPACAPRGSIQAISTCSTDLAMLAMTSPLYLAVDRPPAGRGAPAARPRARLRMRTRALRRTGRTVRARIALGPAGERFDLQARRGRRWRTLLDDSRRRSLVVRVRRGTLVRARIARPGAPDGRWRTARLR